MKFGKKGEVVTIIALILVVALIGVKVATQTNVLQKFGIGGPAENVPAGGVQLGPSPSGCSADLPLLRFYNTVSGDHTYATQLWSYGGANRGFIDFARATPQYKVSSYDPYNGHIFIGKRNADGSWTNDITELAIGGSYSMWYNPRTGVYENLQYEGLLGYMCDYSTSVGITTGNGIHQEYSKTGFVDSRIYIGSGGADTNYAFGSGDYAMGYAHGLIPIYNVLLGSGDYFYTSSYNEAGATNAAFYIDEAACGDGFCVSDEGENCNTCSADCGACGPTTGCGSPDQTCGTPGTDCTQTCAGACSYCDSNCHTQTKPAIDCNTYGAGYACTAAGVCQHTQSCSKSGITTTGYDGSGNPFSYTDSCSGSSKVTYSCSSFALVGPTTTSCLPGTCSGGACVAAPTCTYTYNWGACVNGQQNRTLATATPAGCTGTPDLTSRTCYGTTGDPCTANTQCTPLFCNIPTGQASGTCGPNSCAENAAGAINGFNGGIPFSNSDVCSGNNLINYTCSVTDVNVTSTMTCDSCANGVCGHCGDGTCNGGESNMGCPQDCGYQTCSAEGDGGNGANNYGWIDLASGVSPNDIFSQVNDSCYNSTMVDEVYCSQLPNLNNVAGHVNLTCADDRTCSNGVCVLNLPASCNNNSIDVALGEQCENLPLPVRFINGLDCSSFGFAPGSLLCTACRANVSSCTGLPPNGICGDNVVNIGEQCDTFNISSSLSCQSFGFAGGNLGCSACAIDTSGCTNVVPAFCNNGSIDVALGEQCDNNMFTDSLSCASFGFAGGNLRCNLCRADTTACTGNLGSCGNQSIDVGEQCDGSAVPPIAAGLGCTNFGYNSGSLACGPNCMISVAGCSGAPACNPLTEVLCNGVCQGIGLQCGGCPVGQVMCPAPTGCAASCGNGVNGTITTCNSTIIVPGTYIISNNLVCNGTNGIIVNASNVTIIGNGNNITDSGNGIGIWIDNQTNVIVSNLTIANFSIGILVTDSSEITITDVTVIVSPNNGQGIVFQNSGDSTISGNTVYDFDNETTICMFFRDGSSFNMIRDNVVSDCGEGIYLYNNSDWNTLLNNSVTNNVINGVFLNLNSSSNSLRNNTASSNGVSGVYIASSNFNTLEGDLMDGNGNGLFLENAEGTFTIITITNSVNDGVYVTSGTNRSDIQGTLQSLNVTAGNGDNCFSTNLGAFNIQGAGSPMCFENQFGVIQFTQPVSGFGNNLASALSIAQNNATVDSVAQSGFNRSANIKLFNVAVGSDTIFRDGFVCNAPQCISNVPLITAAGTAGFWVASWTSYSVGNIPGTCTDSDGGTVFGIMGTAANSTLSQTDSCLGNLLTEWDCSGVNVVSQSSNCANGCVNAACAPASCTINSDCAATQICVNGFCQVVDCNSDAQCVNGQFCNMTSGNCQNIVCTTTADCLAGQVCQGGVCRNDTDGSNVCGDWFVANPPESCDLGNLNGSTCLSVNPIFTGGVLGCFAPNVAGNCTFDTSACTSGGPDVNPPVASYVAPTENNGAVLARNNAEVNVSAIDVQSGLASVTIRLYNEAGMMVSQIINTVSPASTVLRATYHNFSLPTQGIYEFNASAVDASGNVHNLATRSINISVGASNDMVAPVITINSPTATTYTVNGVAVDIALNEPGYCEYSMNGGAANQTMGVSANDMAFGAAIANLVNNQYTLTAYCNDMAGNRNTGSVTFTIDVPSGPQGNNGGGGTTYIGKYNYHPLNVTNVTAVVPLPPSGNVTPENPVAPVTSVQQPTGERGWLYYLLWVLFILIIVALLGLIIYWYVVPTWIKKETPEEKAEREATEKAKATVAAREAAKAAAAKKVAVPAVAVESQSMKKFKQLEGDIEVALKKGQVMRAEMMYNELRKNYENMTFEERKQLKRGAQDVYNDILAARKKSLK